MCRIKIWFLACFLSKLVLNFCYSEVIVDTTHGKILGKHLITLIEKKSFCGFIGVPYAAPPVKGLRFLPPQPIGPWDDVLPATKEKPACIQYNINIKKGQPYGRFGSEDCLYLDIYTPALDQGKRPAIVFLHNDGFKNSHNKTKDYAPDFFIEEDTIIVSISHRLTVFGFLSMEDDILPGNAGLKDIVQAIEWYKNNAEQFGGDPDKITLLGSQGGAAAVDLLIHSKARSLLSSAILQGGTSWSPSYLQENVRERAIKLGELLGARSSNSKVLLQNFENINADDFLGKEQLANPTDYFRESQRNILTFGPLVEKHADGLITKYPEDYDDEINIPILIGYNSREGLDAAFHMLMDPKHIVFLNKDFPLLMPRRLEIEFDPIYATYFDAAREIRKRYFPKDKIKLKHIPEYVTYTGDVLKVYSIDYTVEYYANKSRGDLYYYFFDYYSELNENKNNILKLSEVQDGTWGAAPGDELCYLFMCPSLKKQYLELATTDSETMRMQRNLIKMWTNFAKYGNPTPDEKLLGGKTWPVYNKESKQYLHIQKEPQVKGFLNKNTIEFWNNWITKWENFARKMTNENKRDEL